MNKLQKFILENKDYEEKLSSAPYYLKVKTKVDKNGKKYSIFMYNTIKSDWNNEITKLARGCIIDEDGNYICRPYDKFFNSHETMADEIDYTSAIKEEKLDGSIVKLYYHDGEWKFATNGMILAEEAMVNETMTFMDLVKMTEEYVIIMSSHHILDENKDKTFIFELTSPYNKIVVPYNKTKLTLLDIRDNTTGEIINKYKLHSNNPIALLLMNLPYPKQYSLTEDNLQIEGFVVKDTNGKMIKIKNAWYVSAHHMKGENINKSILDIWLSNEASEFLSYFPEMTNKYNFVNDFMIQKYCEIERVLKELNNRKFQTRKEIALFIRENGDYSIIWKYVRKDLSIISDESCEMLEDIKQFLYGKFKDEIIHKLKEIV